MLLSDPTDPRGAPDPGQLLTALSTEHVTLQGARSQTISPGTLFFAASTAKGLAASVAHVLVECGELAYDQRVADSWSQFAAHTRAASRWLMS